MEEETGELKPCPFCGGEAGEEYVYCVDDEPDIFLGCLNKKCLVKPSIVVTENKKKEHAKWNTRMNDYNGNRASLKALRLPRS